MTEDEYRAAAQRLAAYDLAEWQGPTGDCTDMRCGILVARRLLELLPPTDDNKLVSVDWFRSVGAEVKEYTKDGYVWCAIETNATTQEFSADGEPGRVLLEFGFREDGSLYDAVVATYLGLKPTGSDVNIARPVTRGKVRKLAEVYGTKLKETA